MRVCVPVYVHSPQSTVCIGSTISNAFVVTRLNMCSFFYHKRVGILCVIINCVKTGHWKGNCRDPCWLNPAPYRASPSLPQSQGSISRIWSGGVHFVGRPCRLPPATWRPVRCHLQVNCHQTAFLLMFSTNNRPDFYRFFFLQIFLYFLFILTEVLYDVVGKYCGKDIHFMSSQGLFIPNSWEEGTLL